MVLSCPWACPLLDESQVRSSAAWADALGCLGLEPPVAEPQLLLVAAHAALEMTVILNIWVPKETFPCPMAGLEAHT